MSKRNFSHKQEEYCPIDGTKLFYKYFTGYEDSWWQYECVECGFWYSNSDRTDFYDAARNYVKGSIREFRDIPTDTQIESEAEKYRRKLIDERDSKKRGLGKFVDVIKTHNRRKLVREALSDLEDMR